MGVMKAIEIGVFIWILSFSLAAASEIFGSGTGSVVDSDFDSSSLASRFLTPNFLDILYMMWDVMGLLSKIMLKGALLGTTVSSLIPHPFGIPPFNSIVDLYVPAHIRRQALEDRDFQFYCRSLKIVCRNETPEALLLSILL